MTPGEEAALAFVADLAKEVEAEVTRLRTQTAAMVEALATIAAGRLDHEHGLDDFHDRARTVARDALRKAAQS
jgi:hypothetical protein